MLHPRLRAAAGNRAPGGVIDDFERESLDYYSGDTSEFSIATDQFYQGSRSLKHDRTGIGDHRIYSTSGLGRYYSKGDGSLDARFYIGSESSPDVVYSMFFGVENLENLFAVDIRQSSGGRLRIFKVVGGSFSSLATTTSVSVPSSEWLRILVEWASNGDITYELFNQANTLIGSVTANSSDLGVNTGIGVAANVGSSVRRQLWVDNIQVVD